MSLEWCFLEHCTPVPAEVAASRRVTIVHLRQAFHCTDTSESRRHIEVIEGQD